MEPPDQVSSLLSRLLAVPEQIASMTEGWSEEDLGVTPSGEEWSAAQILAHLRASDDILAYRAYAILARDDVPQLPVFDERRWAQVTGYESMDFLASLMVFTVRRAELIRILRRITPDDWQRTGTREGIGPVSILEGMTRLVEHEEEHCAQLETIRRMRMTRG